MHSLPYPCLEEATLGGIPVITDEGLFQATGVRIAFTGREGGVSQGAYSSLNLGSHVEDSLQDVLENRQRLVEALGFPDAQILVPNQVHGSHVQEVISCNQEHLDCVRRDIAQGADGILVEPRGVAALLCYADCTPVIAVAPSGRFAVVHAGWRGAVAGIVGKAVEMLSAKDDPSQINVYIGPHIRQECFETGPDVAARFAEAFGSQCVPDERHVSLAQAVIADALSRGVDSSRVADAGVCTKCNSQTYYSYRASGGVCGRHGAIAVGR